MTTRIQMVTSKLIAATILLGVQTPAAEPPQGLNYCWRDISISPTGMACSVTLIPPGCSGLCLRDIAPAGVVCEECVSQKSLETTPLCFYSTPPVATFFSRQSAACAGFLCTACSTTWATYAVSTIPTQCGVVLKPPSTKCP